MLGGGGGTGGDGGGGGGGDDEGVGGGAGDGGGGSAAAAQRVMAPSGADRVCSRLLPALPERVDAVMSHPWHTRGPPGPMMDATSCSTAGSQ